MNWSFIVFILVAGVFFLATINLIFTLHNQLRRGK